jgi:hypothetical protein
MLVGSFSTYKLACRTVSANKYLYGIGLPGKMIMATDKKGHRGSTAINLIFRE